MFINSQAVKTLNLICLASEPRIAKSLHQLKFIDQTINRAILVLFVRAKLFSHHIIHFSALWLRTESFVYTRNGFH
jgi:hypothetical protein